LAEAGEGKQRQKGASSDLLEMTKEDQQIFESLQVNILKPQRMWEPHEKYNKINERYLLSLGRFGGIIRGG